MISVGQPDLTGNEALYALQAIQSTRLSMGPFVERFERTFAEYIGVRYALACSNGTAALHLALMALGIGPGDEVIVPSLTFVSTANAVVYTGAKPVFVDVNPATWTIDPKAVEAAVTERTKAIIPVHLYGLPADMVSLRRINVPIIEDAAESLGAEVRGLKTGALGEMGCFSFYGNKTISTGEGGMVTTDNAGLAERIKLLRGQGQAARRNFWHIEVGYNYRMTDVQAAIGCAQMERVQNLVERRIELMQLYRALLHGCTLQTGYSAMKHGAWGMMALVPQTVNRDAVRMQLWERGIETRPAFYPVHTMPMYATGQCLPHTTRIAERGIMLPLHTGLSNDDVRFICEAVYEVTHEHRHAVPVA